MLRKKLVRTFLKYKAQFLSMIIMIALGVGVFVGFNMEWYSLRRDVDFILDATGFADYRIYSDKGFSKEDLDAILQIDGVEDATRFMTVNTTVKDDTDVIAIAVSENMKVSGIYSIEGAEYDPASPDGLWLSDQYAARNGISVGDEMTLTYKTLTVKGVVKGLVKASEFMICVPDETQLMPDFNSYGFAYISPEMLNSIIPAIFRNLMGGNLYYQINVRSSLDKKVFVEAAEAALGRTSLVLSKNENISWSESNGEVEEGKTMGSILPVLFLAIAILTMVTTMHRITASEKTQIGTLKALGFRDRKILLHYSSYALVIGLIGTVLGIGIGFALALYILNPDSAMGTYIDLPFWNLYVPWPCWIILAGMNIFLVAIGYLSVKEMLKGTAADTLRPYTPPKMKHLALEETRFFKRLNFGTKWNLRDCFRHRSRTLMTLFGIVGCMVLLVGGLGMKDTMDAFMQSFFEEAIRYETRINLDPENISNEEAAQLALSYDGDYSAMSSVQVDDRPVSLEIYHITNDLVRFTDEQMKNCALEEDGAYVCARLAKELGLKAGDELRFSPYDSDETYTVRIRGILRSMSESVVMTDTYADQAGVDYTFNTIYTNDSEIEANDYILNTQTRKAIMDSFDTFIELMVVMVALLVLAAVILSLVVLYNLGVMSYTERYREMATLKVVGFKNKKIAKLLITQNLWLSVIGILIGLPAGVGVLQYLLDALASEYEMKLALGPLTYIVSIALTFGVSLIVGLLIAARNRRIDMVAALKTQE